MKPSSLLKTAFAFLLVLFFFTPSEAQVTGLGRIRWTREKIAPGLVWKTSHTYVNDTIPQNINALFVNLKKRAVHIQYDASKNSPVSKQASGAGAVAAVNAGFFNIKDGGSVTYVRTDGIIADTDTASKWRRNSNMTGAILITGENEVTIQKSMPNSWFDEHPEFSDVLVTGPLLLKDGKPVKMPETSLVIMKHPRTAAGLISDRKLLLITLDGRTPEAYGMTLPELTELLRLFGCRDAINLDGGGSTTMWISGKPYDGVVNMPCDNKLFDHLGERPVSDILIIK